MLRSRALLGHRAEPSKPALRLPAPHGLAALVVQQENLYTAVNLTAAANTPQIRVQQQLPGPHR